MHRPFSDPKYIEKMVRQISVLDEQASLTAYLAPWPHSPYRNKGHWVKYVSGKKPDKLEILLYWDNFLGDQFCADINHDLLQDPGFFQKQIDFFKKSYRDFEQLADEIYHRPPDYFAQQTDREIIAGFEKFYLADCYLWGGYYIAFNVLDAVLKLIEAEIKAVLPDRAAAEETIKTLSTAGITSLVREEHLAWLAVLARIQKYYRQTKNWPAPEIQKEIFDHWYKFGPCSYTHVANKTFSLADYQAKFKKSLDLDVPRETAKLQAAFQREQKIFKNAIKSWRGHQELCRHIAWLRELMEYRNYQAEFYRAHLAHAAPFLEEIQRHLHVTATGLKFLSYEEILAGLRGQTDKIRDIVKQRQEQGFTIKQQGDKIVVSTGVKPEDWHELDPKMSGQELHGMVVYPGKVRGKVRAVFDPRREAVKFQPGEILVTPMTTPEFVPLLKKASAIITDEGGLLCHAAIVARELKIPCIIGTTQATSTLKTGDQVEMDTEHGIIKIIK